MNEFYGATLERSRGRSGDCGDDEDVEDVHVVDDDDVAGGEESARSRKHIDQKTVVGRMPRGTGGAGGDAAKVRGR